MALISFRPLSLYLRENNPFPHPPKPVWAFWIRENLLPGLKPWLSSPFPCHYTDYVVRAATCVRDNTVIRKAGNYVVKRARSRVDFAGNNFKNELLFELAALLPPKKELLATCLISSGVARFLTTGASKHNGLH
jgi:hypothetical protein